MKQWTKEQEDATWNANLEGGLKGLAIGSTLFTASHLSISRFSPTYKRMPIPLKTFGFVVCTIPFISYFAETAGDAYQKTQWIGIGKEVEDAEVEAKRIKWEKLSGGEKVKEWAKEKQWSIVGASWAGSMVVAGLIVSRNPYQSFSQKLVQARMWAQGLTVAVVIASGVMAGMSSTGEKPVPKEDHSWRRVLEQQEKDAEIAKVGREFRQKATA